MTQIGVAHKTIIKVQGQELENTPDLLVVEIPLEIRLIYKDHEDSKELPITVTMRTPGNDKDLVVGFLFTEGIIHSIDAIKSIYYCQTTSPEYRENVLKVVLQPNCSVDTSLLNRNFAATSSCGVCGKRSLNQLTETWPKAWSPNLKITLNTVYGLSKKLIDKQCLFNHTGGLHAAALFDKDGTLLYIREDIGRHNALDKVIGHVVKTNKKLFQEAILFLSSRIGYEIIQKAAIAGIPLVIAAGAPSKLAVQIAEEAGVTLIGFAKNTGFNIYSCAERIIETKNSS